MRRVLGMCYMLGTRCIASTTRKPTAWAASTKSIPMPPNRSLPHAARRVRPSPPHCWTLFDPLRPGSGARITGKTQTAFRLIGLSRWRCGTSRASISVGIGNERQRADLNACVACSAKLSLKAEVKANGRQDDGQGWRSAPVASRIIAVSIERRAPIRSVRPSSAS